MTDYFLPNYDTNWYEKLTFPILPVYSVRHMEAAWEAKTWLGRSVHLILSTLESSHFIGPLVALIEAYCAWYFKQISDDEDAIEDVYIEEDNLSDHLIEKLEHASSSAMISPMVVSPQKDEIKNESVALPLLPDKVMTQKEATQCILATSGFIAEPDDKPSWRGFYKGEIQGTQALRYAVAKVTKSFPEAIGPEALKEEREINLEQYLTIKIKRFGHAFSLKGCVTLPSSKRVNLEGFCEAFTIPMLTASFLRYARYGKFFSSEDVKWIAENFNQTTSSDHTEPDDIQTLACLVQDPLFMGPIALGTGYDWHSTATIFFANYIIYCNRGVGDPSGIHIYYIPDRSFLTEAVIWEMTKRQELGGEECFGTERIVSDLKGMLVHYEKLSDQAAGNCTLVSMETALFAFMVMRSILNLGLTNDYIDAEMWEELFENLRTEYGNWWDIDREHIFEDMVDEIQEWMDKTNSFSKHNLQQTYQELLNAWHYDQSICGKALTPLIESLKQKVQDARHA